MNDVQFYELFGGIAFKNHAFFLHSLFIASIILHHAEFCFHLSAF